MYIMKNLIYLHVKKIKIYSLFILNKILLINFIFKLLFICFLKFIILFYEDVNIYIFNKNIIMILL